MPSMIRSVVWDNADAISNGAGITENRRAKCNSASQAMSYPNSSANCTWDITSA